MDRMEVELDTCKLVIREGDLTRYAGDAIVNAANERMLGGGGVDGAIHRAAGPALRRACEQVEEVAPGVRCPTGEARITEAYGLPCQHVIHTVGPVFESPTVSAPLLARCFESCLDLAEQHGIRSIAFPAVSCGVYGYPMDAAAHVALKICRARSEPFAEIHFILFGEEACAIWQRVARGGKP